MSRSTRTMGPPHRGQRHSGDAAAGVESDSPDGVVLTATASSWRQSGSKAARRRWAKKPKCRMRTVGRRICRWPRVGNITTDIRTYGDVREAYDLICTGKVNVRPMITHRLPLSEYARGFDFLLRSPKEAFKVVLCPQSAGTGERSD